MDEKNDLKRNAYKFIRKRIITGEFVSGQDINEREIQEQISMSRTPIREALIQLKWESFIEVFPRKGIFVAPITTKMINNIYQIRDLFEPTILKLSEKKLDKDKLLEFKEVFENIPADLQFSQLNDYFIKWDNAFHFFIINSSQNELLVKIMDNILNHNQRIRYQSYNKVNKRYMSSNIEHILVINALLQGNVEEASNYMRQHIANSRNIALSLDNIVR